MVIQMHHLGLVNLCFQICTCSLLKLLCFVFVEGAFSVDLMGRRNWVRRTLILCVQVLACEQEVWERSVYRSFSGLASAGASGTGLHVSKGDFFLLSIAVLALPLAGGYKSTLTS